MNELNYASLEASKRLVNAGIVLLDAEHWWWKKHDGSDWYVDLFPTVDRIVRDDRTPAPLLSEVWRELPYKLGKNYLSLWRRQDGHTVAEYENMELAVFRNTNPTDALIDLLIWQKGRTP